MEIYYSESPEDTEQFAERFAKTLRGGDIIAFKGGLGMGKTCFTRGLAKGLGYNGTVTSPTFALINEYSGGRLPIYHFDMYRITNWEELYSSGYFEYCDEPGVVVVEWSENIENALSDRAIYVKFENTGENKRKITVRKADENE